MDYNELEYRILMASVTFAEDNNIEFNDLHKSMMVNAMREVNHQSKKATTKLTDSEFASLHDTYLEVMGEKLDNDKLLDVYLLLPDELRADGVRYGLDDSVVRDNVFEYLTSIK